MFDMMNWNPDHRYKMLGNIIRANGEYLIAFDLTSTEVYQRTYDEEGTKSTASRTPVYIAESFSRMGWGALHAVWNDKVGFVSDGSEDVYSSKP